MDMRDDQEPELEEEAILDDKDEGATENPYVFGRRCAFQSPRSPATWRTSFVANRG